MEQENQGKDLIMGLAMNYDWKTIEPFFVSLHQSGFQGDVVIFTCNIPDEAKKKLQQYNVINIPFQRMGLEAIIHPNDYRFYLYKAYLNNTSEKYRLVMLTDVRDVIFQDTPFKPCWPTDKILVAVEAKLTIRDDACNSRWIFTKFGPHIFYEICDYPIICAGTTVGPLNLVHYYLDSMLKCILFQGGYHQGHDQGTHNYLIYTKKIAPIAFVNNNSGLFLTVGLEDQININSAGKIMTQGGIAAAIVHQYDRHQCLVDVVNRLYREKDTSHQQIHG